MHLPSESKPDCPIKQDQDGNRALSSREVVKLNLISRLSPGDICTMTAAVYNLHRTYPGEYLTSVETPVKQIWENNPDVVEKGEDFLDVEIHYPTIHNSNQSPVSFIAGYTTGLAIEIKRPIVHHTNKPVLYLSDEERGWMNQIKQIDPLKRDVPFMLVCAGIKDDFTCKQWPLHYYQKVVDETYQYINWVQIGAKEHRHHRLHRVYNLVGRTDHRQLIRLVYHSKGTLSPVTYLHHLAAAFDKPSIVLLGGREPLQWVSYPKSHILHTIGLMDCCRDGACWKSQVIPIGDPKDKTFCENPVLALDVPVARCMAMIEPEQVIPLVKKIASRTNG